MGRSWRCFVYYFCSNILWTWSCWFDFDVFHWKWGFYELVLFLATFPSLCKVDILYLPVPFDHHNNLFCFIPSFTNYVGFSGYHVLLCCIDNDRSSGACSTFDCRTSFCEYGTCCISPFAFCWWWFFSSKK